MVAVADYTTQVNNQVFAKQTATRITACATVYSIAYPVHTNYPHYQLFMPSRDILTCDASHCQPEQVLPVSKHVCDATHACEGSTDPP